jgi:hypothetical protein
VLLGEADRHRRRQIDVDVVGLQVGAVRDPELQPSACSRSSSLMARILTQDLAQQAALLPLRRDGLLDRFRRRAASTPASSP